MKTKMHYFLIVIFILLSCMILINNYFSSDLHITSIQINQKEHIDKKYVITASSPDNSQLIFHIKESDVIFVKINASESEDKSISTFWSDIEEGKEYYVVYNKLRFPYNLFDSDIKLRQIHFY